MFIRRTSKNGNGVLSNMAWKSAILMGAGTFFLAIAAGLSSQFLLRQNAPVLISFALLLLIILVGIFFDIIGVAAAAASEAPLHARAAKKVHGSRQALRLVRHADRVANFCNDVVGDVAGTLSGAVGASIALRLLLNFPDTGKELLVSILLTAAVASLTVGGKALGKSLAIRESHEIILRVGIILYWLEKTIGVRFLADNKGRSRKGRSQ